MINIERIAEVLQPYGIPLPAGLADKVRIYMDLLLRWNARIGLTAIRDELEIVRFHFGESFFAARAVGLERGRLADVGSGAGFPGLPLKLISPALEIMLLEPSMKKAAFLGEVIRALELNNVVVERKRFEDLKVPAPGFDFITSRALGDFEAFARWARRSLAAGGRLVLWVGSGDADEIMKIGGWNWQSPVSIPYSRRRVLLAGTPAG